MIWCVLFLHLLLWVVVRGSMEYAKGHIWGLATFRVLAHLFWWVLFCCHQKYWPHLALIWWCSLLLLMWEFCCSPGMMSNLHAGSLTWCRSFACSYACASCPNGIWNIYSNGMLVWTKELLGHPLVEVHLESATMEGILPLSTSCIICYFFFMVLLFVNSIIAFLFFLLSIGLFYPAVLCLIFVILVCIVQ